MTLHPSPVYHTYRPEAAISEAEARAIVSQWAQLPDAPRVYADAVDYLDAAAQDRERYPEGHPFRDDELRVRIIRVDGEFVVVGDDAPPGTLAMSWVDLLDLPGQWDDSNDVLTAHEARAIAFTALRDCDFPFEGRDATYCYKPGELFDVHDAGGGCLSVVALQRDGSEDGGLFQIEDATQVGVERALCEPDNERLLLAHLERRVAQDPLQTDVDAPRRPRP